MSVSDLGLFVLYGCLVLLLLYVWLLRPRVSVSVNNNILIAIGAAGAAAMIVARNWLAAGILIFSVLDALRDEVKRRRREERMAKLNRSHEKEKP